MAVLSRQEVFNLARSVGLNVDQAIIAGAICDAESGRRTDAVGVNVDERGRPVNRDRGLWQINDYWHPDVSDACAFDPGCNARAMARISNGGRNWTPWTTYNIGSYRQFLNAYEHLLGGDPLPPPPPAFSAVHTLVQLIRSGQPAWLAVLRTMEALFTNIRRTSGEPNAAQTDLGSRFF